MSEAERNFKEALALAKKSHDNWLRNILIMWAIVLVPCVVASAAVCYRISVQ